MPPKPHPFPPKNFHELDLPIEVIQPANYYRLNNANHSSAIYYDKSGQGRFDGPDLSYNICYVGESLEAAFIETFGRDLGVRFVSIEMLRSRNLFMINSTRKLKLINLFGPGLNKLGVDSEISSGRNYNLSRSWTEAIYNHPAKVDGIRYYSRHDNTQLCCGLFHRTKGILAEKNKGNLYDKNPQTLGNLLNRYNFGIG